METLPGINDVNQSLAGSGGDDEFHKLSIAQGSEWNIEVSSDTKLTIRVISGIAEIFGTELAIGREYNFRNYKFGLFAVEDVELEWRCPELNVETLPKSISPNSTAKLVYNLHFALEKMRSSSFDGPRVMVVGETSSGRTSLCRMLCSYAIKFKPYQPLYVNLDPQQAIFSPPGCVTATPISDILDVQCSTWGQSMTSGATPLHSKQPLVKNYGLERLSENKQLYYDSVEQLATSVNDRLMKDSLVRRSGLMIDIPAISDLDVEYDDLVYFAKQFKANVVVLLGISDTKMVDEIAKKLGPLIGGHMVSLPKVSGSVQPDDSYKRSLQRSAIREYFYGTPDTVLSPYAVGVSFEDITVYRPRNLFEDPQQDHEAATQLLPVEINPNNLQHALVAISYADRKAGTDIIQKAPILGFGLITEVNDKRNKLRILLPVPGALPNKPLILTSHRYLE